MPSALSSQRVPCAHCGLPAPAAAPGTPAFCCPGCRTVYRVLTDAGLCDFYSLREEFDPPAEPASATVDVLGAGRYAHFDHLEFLREHDAEPGRIDLRLEGLHCAACVWLLERLPRALPGVLDARVDFGTARLSLRWDPDEIALSKIAEFVAQLGYPPHVVSAEADAAQRRRDRGELWRLALTGAMAGNVMLASLALYAGELASMDVGFASLFEWIGLVLAIPAVTWGALPFYRGAWSGLRMRMLHMDLPISLGIAAGFGASAHGTLTGSGAVYYDTVTILVFLLLLGRTLQSWGQRRVLTQVEMMNSLAPGSARRRTSTGWETTYVGALDEGDHVLVAAGETIAVDGQIVAGRAHADLSLLTGESRPVLVDVGAQVFAGTSALDGEIEVQVEAIGDQTRLGGIVRRLAQQDEPAPFVRLADRLSGWFVAAVLTLATIGGVVWASVDPSRAFDVVVALLVVSCPCALGLATPMALSVARGRATKAGILVRSSAALETLAEVRDVVLDKTGTITEGRLRVVDTQGFDPTVARWVAALEAHASHPAARSLVHFAQDAHEGTKVESWQEHPGCGMEGLVEGHRIRVGSTRWLGIPTGLQAFADEALDRALSPIAIEVDSEVIAMVAVGDQLRSGAGEVLASLQRRGRRIFVASGDHPRVVEAIAARLEVDGAAGGLSPEAKAEIVLERAPCAMVGDGINDALALRTAAVGVAVRGGAEAALQVADVYLASSDLRSLQTLLDGAHRTFRVIRRNLGFSLTYNVLFASLALAGLITPLMAAVLMPLSSVTVIASSYLSRTFQRDGDRTPTGHASSAPLHESRATVST